MPYHKEPQDFRILLSKNIYFKNHFHPQAELILCTIGEIKLTIDETVYTLYQNDCAIIFPNQSHSYSREHEDNPNEGYIAIIPMNYVEDFETELDTTFPTNPIIKSPELPPHFIDMFEILYTSSNTEKPDIRLYKAFSNMLLAYIIPKLTLKSASHSYDLALTPRILNYLAANKQQALTLESVAKTFGISKNTLSHIFTRELDTTYLNYITSIRLEAAKKLLKKTNYSIAEIAEQSGFQSERSFYRVFATQMNCSPAQYRKQLNPAKK